MIDIIYSNCKKKKTVFDISEMWVLYLLADGAGDGRGVGVGAAGVLPEGVVVLEGLVAFVTLKVPLSHMFDMVLDQVGLGLAGVAAGLTCELSLIAAAQRVVLQHSRIFHLAIFSFLHVLTYFKYVKY